MNPDSLVKEFADELRQIASRTEYSRISCVELIVGKGFGISASDIEDAFETFWGNPKKISPDDKLYEAVTTVTLVRAGETFSSPGRSDTQTAIGWEILIANIHGII